MTWREPVTTIALAVMVVLMVVILMGMAWIVWSAVWEPCR